MTGINSLEFRHKEAYTLFNNWLIKNEKEFEKEVKISKPNFKLVDDCNDVVELRNKSFELLEDFLKPTYIRDVYYNIYGEFKGDLTTCKTIRV